MELAGHKCVGFCEWDKFALASYTSMHLLTEEQRAYLSSLSFKERQIEIRKEVYRNGEWYAADIRTVHGWTIPKTDLWCFGAPCQDFSVAGARAGLAGDRSSLVREVFRILEEMEEADRPEWLLYENVKGMLSSRSGLDYLSILLEMERLGYDVEWQVFNSKDWAVPQNRERVYTLGHFRGCSGSAVFPLAPADGENCSFIEQVAHLDGSIDNPNAYRVYAASGIGPCLTGKSGGGTEPSIVLPLSEPGRAEPTINIVGLIGGSRAEYGYGEDENRVMSVTGIGCHPSSYEDQQAMQELEKRSAPYTSKFKVGASIKHPSFGTGKILKITAYHDTAVLLVSFDNDACRKIDELWLLRNQRR